MKYEQNSKRRARAVDMLMRQSGLVVPQTAIKPVSDIPLISQMPFSCCWSISGMHTTFCGSRRRSIVVYVDIRNPAAMPKGHEPITLCAVLITATWTVSPPGMCIERIDCRSCIICHEKEKKMNCYNCVMFGTCAGV